MPTFSETATGTRAARELIDSSAKFTSGATDRQSKAVKRGFYACLDALGDGRESASLTLAATVTASSCVISVS